MNLTSVALFLTLFLSPLIWADNASEKSQSVKAAVTYLEALTLNEYPLEEKTSLSIHCEISRRKEIRNQLEFYRKTNLNKGDVYTLAAYKSAGNFAALLLRTENPTFPLRSHIHAIAMVKRGDLWVPAPIPSSFANTNYGYDQETEKAVKSLEQWMTTEQVKLESSVREKASRNMLTKISQREKELELDGITPEQAVHRLIQAARSKDLLKTLAMTGAASGQPSTPLETLSHQISQGLQIEDTENKWSFITNSSVIVQILNLDPDKKRVTVGFWNPNTTPEEEVLHFPFFETKGKTFTQLPQELSIALLTKGDRARNRRWDRNNGKRQLKEQIAPFIFENNQAAPQPDPKSLLAEFLKFHHAENFQELVRLLPAGSRYFEEETAQKENLEELSILWRKVSQMKKNPIKVLDIMQEGKTAMAPLQFAQIGKPGEFTTVKIWMTLVDENWYLIPESILKEYGDAKERKTMDQLSKKLESAQKKHQNQQSKKMLAGVVRLTLPLTLDAPTEQEAKSLLTSYRKMLHSKETLSALASCAVLNQTGDNQILKSFNNALRSASDKVEQESIIGYSQSGKWTGITLLNKSNLKELDDYPLYLIVNTPKGHKVLLDIDLRHPTNRGRRLLNNKMWKQLEESLPEASLKEIQSIFDVHQKTSLANIAKNGLKKEDE